MKFPALVPVAPVLTFATLDETKELVRILEGSRLDAIHISGVPPARTYYSPPGYFVPAAGEIKKITSLPVIVAGAIAMDNASTLNSPRRSW